MFRLSVVLENKAESKKKVSFVLISPRAASHANNKFHNVPKKKFHGCSQLLLVLSKQVIDILLDGTDLSSSGIAASLGHNCMTHKIDFEMQISSPSHLIGSYSSLWTESFVTRENLRSISKVNMCFWKRQASDTEVQARQSNDQLGIWPSTDTPTYPPYPASTHFTHHSHKRPSVAAL